MNTDDDLEKMFDDDPSLTFLVTQYLTEAQVLMAGLTEGEMLAQVETSKARFGEGVGEMCISIREALQRFGLLEFFEFYARVVAG